MVEDPPDASRKVFKQSRYESKSIWRDRENPDRPGWENLCSMFNGTSLIRLDVIKIQLVTI